MLKSTRFLLLLGFISAKALSIEVSKKNVKDFEPGPRLQFADCYDYEQGNGAGFHVSDYIPVLRNYGWDNKISSCCFTGIWILYGDENYNKFSSNGAIWWAFGINNCLDVPSEFNNDASSIRHPGAQDDYMADTLNLYFADKFSGDEEYMYTDMPLLNFDDRARSVIVTGCNPWTLYEYDNYGGSAMCVFPGSTVDCTPGLYPTSESLGSLAGRVSSTRKGCYAQEHVLPVNHGARMEGNGLSGFFSV